MKKPTVSSLKKKLDRLFSIWVRSSAANHQGYARCYTCRTTKKWKELQAGHYISRSNNATRFSEINVKPQCVACNIFKHGNIPEFALHLVKDYGEHILKTLSKESRKIRQFSIKELQEMIKLYK